MAVNRVHHTVRINKQHYSALAALKQCCNEASLMGRKGFLFEDIEMLEDTFNVEFLISFTPAGDQDVRFTEDQDTGDLDLVEDPEELPRTTIEVDSTMIDAFTLSIDEMTDGQLRGEMKTYAGLLDEAISPSIDRWERPNLLTAVERLRKWKDGDDLDERARELLDVQEAKDNDPWDEDSR